MYGIKSQVTPVDELAALLDDYAGEGPCSCPESALLRWMVRRMVDGSGPDDFGLALTARRRMERIDREQCSESVANEANPNGHEANEDENAPRAIRTMTPDEEAAWLAEAGTPRGRHAYEALFDRMEIGRPYRWGELVALAGGDETAAHTLLVGARLVRRVPTHLRGVSAYVRDAQ